MALPGAAVNTMTVAERLGLKERVRRLIALAERLGDRGTVVRLDTGGRLRELAGMTGGQVLDAADRVRDDTA